MRKTLFILLVLVLLGCQGQEKPAPVVVIVTATFVEPIATDTPATDPPTVETAPPSFPTATNTPTIEGLPSPTPFLSATPTNTDVPFPSSTPGSVSDAPSPSPFPTLTPGGVVVTIAPPTVEAVQPFPTATPSPIEPTQVIIAPPTDVAAPATQVAAVADPAAAVIPPAAVSDLAPAPEQLPIIAASHVGVQVHPFVTNEMWAHSLGLTRQLGMEWVKFQVPWDISEPAPGDYSFQYERMILLVQEAHIQGFKVLVSVTRAPAWSRPANADPNAGGPPADPQALANFITKLTSDIKPEFMEAIEIWNEPNLYREWAGVPMTGAEYMRYFEPAYRAAKAVDPSAVVVTAGLAPVGDLEGTLDDRRFLAEMYAAGLMNFPDARIGVHPYGWANPPDARCCSDGGWQDSPKFFFLDTLDEYRQIALDNNDPNRQFWLTEMGWGTYESINTEGQSAAPPPHAAFFERISLTQQAEYTVRALELVQQQPYSDFVELTFLWNMNFATIENAISDQLEQAGYSMLDAGGSPRPVFYYLLNTRKLYDVE